VPAGDAEVRRHLERPVLIQPEIYHCGIDIDAGNPYPHGVYVVCRLGFANLLGWREG